MARRPYSCQSWSACTFIIAGFIAAMASGDSSCMSFDHQLLEQPLGDAFHQFQNDVPDKTVGDDDINNATG